VTNVSATFKTNTGDGGASVVQTISQSKSATSTGSGDAHNIVQPTIILNYIIKE
jgi:microcystin-dependent protein